MANEPIEKIYEDVQLHIAFSQAASRSNIVTYDSTAQEPENISTAFGKLSKWYEALVPTGGSSGKILAWNSLGTAKWSDPLHPTITKSADTTSTASPAHGGTFTTVDSVTRDANGHVTKINTKTITLPSDQNTDTLMTQTNTTTSADYRVLLSGNANDTTETTTGRKSTNLKFNPSSGGLYSFGFLWTDITGQTLDINTLTLSDGTLHSRRFIEKTDGGATNITNIPVTGHPFLLEVDLIRWGSTTDYITRQRFTNAANGTYSYVRYCTNGTWGNWTTRKYTDTNTKVTSSANHYAPTTVSGEDKSASATGATAAWSIDVVKGVTLNTDGKGHVTGISVTSGKIPANPVPSNNVTGNAAWTAADRILVTNAASGNVIKQSAYTIGATLNSGTTNQLAYYSGANAISATHDGTNTGDSLYFKTGTNAKSSRQIILGIYGQTYGNDAAALISGTAGVFSYGDGGPQIDFNTSVSGSQAGALIFTDHDSAATGASWHFVSNQADWNVTSKRFHARTSISIGTDLPQKSYNLYVNGTSQFNGTTTISTNAFGTQLTVERSGSSNYASLGFKNNLGMLGYIGANATDANLYHIYAGDTSKQYIILDTGNTSVTTSGSGNAITALSFSNGTFTATKGSTFSLSTHTHNYAGSSSAGGAATHVATEVGNSAGARPVFFAYLGDNTRVVYNTNFTYNPSGNVLKATTFDGALSGNASKTGIRWNAVSQGQKWSRLYYSETAVNIEGSNGILSISCTRGNVVVNAVFLVFVSHSGSNASHIIELASTNYSTIRCRVVSNSSGSYYFEIYDTANNIASGTSQTWHCCFVTLTDATLTTYTTFTDGSTIPSNFAAANDFTTTVGKASAAIKDISRSGTTFTATRQDGTTFTFTQQDNNTTYSANNGVGLSGTTFYNSGVRAVSTGSTNGTISVNTNGTTGDVAVKGLASAAYVTQESLLRARSSVTTDGGATGWAQIGINQYNNAYPDGVTNKIYSYGAVVSIPAPNARFDLYYNHNSSTDDATTNGLQYRTGWDNDKKAWRMLLDSGNYKSYEIVLRRGNAGKSNMNDVGRLYASVGMTDLSDPGNNYDNPMNGTTKSTSWHLYWDASYKDDPNGSNSWVAQIVNKAGTAQWWVRSRKGGTITNGTEWAAGWEHLTITSQAGAGSATNPVYVDSNGHTQACTYSLNKSVPSNALFTDSNVRQSATTTTDYRPIVTGAKNTTTIADLDDEITSTVYTSENFFVQPSTGSLYATQFFTKSYLSGTGVNVTSNGIYARSYFKRADNTVADYKEYLIRTYNGKITSNDGILVSVGGGGLTIVGGGESSSALAGLISDDQTKSDKTTLNVGGTLNTAIPGNSEQLIMSSDESIYFITNCQTIANRKPVCLNTSSYFYPGTNKTGSIGTSSYMWNSVYAATIYENGTSLASKYAAIGHAHGLLHSDLTQVASNGTTGGWSVIGIDPAVNGYVLKSIRINETSPNWLSGGYGAGIAFGGYDTKGVISMRWDSPVITFAGGNHKSTITSPKWYFKISGTSGSTYDLANFNAATATTATKLETARNIALAEDFAGSADFDGSGNISISGTFYRCSASSNNTANYPWHRIAYRTGVTGNYNDTDAIFMIRAYYNGGPFGIIKVTMRTNGSGANCQVAARWLVRQNIAANDVYIAQWGKTGQSVYADIFLKGSTYNRTYVYQIAGSRSWTLVNSGEASDTTTSDKKTSTEVYASIAAAGTTLHNQAYTQTVAGIDEGHVNSANSATYATRADYVNVVASNEIRFYNDNQFKANNHFWLGYSWADGSHYTPSGGSDTSSTTAPNITEFVMGNCTAGGLASVHAKTFILGNGSSPTKSSKTTTIATAATTTDRTITLPNASGNVILGTKGSTSFWGLMDGAGSISEWIRATSSGFIPSQGAKFFQTATSSLGTNTWYFKNSYIQYMNANSLILGAAKTADGAAKGQLKFFSGNSSDATGTVTLECIDDANRTGDYTVKLPTCNGTIPVFEKLFEGASNTVSLSYSDIDEYDVFLITVANSNATSEQVTVTSVWISNVAGVHDMPLIWGGAPTSSGGACNVTSGWIQLSKNSGTTTFIVAHKSNVAQMTSSGWTISSPTYNLYIRKIFGLKTYKRT